MKTEIGNNSTLFGCLQKLGAGRQTGTLALKSSQRSLVLAFQSGKIVAMSEEGINAAQSVAIRLVDAGRVVEQVLGLVHQAQVSIEQLGKVLIGKEYVKSEEFDRASRTFELNALYQLRAPDSWEMRFEPGKSLPVRPGGVTMTTAQLLLDLAELESDEPRFNDLFGGLRCEDRHIDRTAEEPSGLSKDEQVIWETIGLDGCSPLDVTEMSLLSDYSIIVGLLALHDQNAISVEAPSQAEELEPMSAEPYDDDVVWENKSISRFADELVEPVDERHQNFRKSQPTSQSQSQADVVAQIASRRDRQSDEPQPVDEFPPEFEPDGNKWSEKLNGHRRWLFLRTLNYRMLEPAMLQRAVLVLMVGFLALVAWVAPFLFDDWFKALTEFSKDA